MSRTIRFFTILSGLLTLLGCQSHLHTSDLTGSTHLSTVQDDSRSDIATTDSPNSEISSTVPELTAESLYDLMTAELASKQNRLDITLGNYLKQAHATQDPAIVQRTTRIARYMKAHQATLDAAALWVKIEPNNVEALQTLTMQLVQIGDFKTAFVYMDRLISANSQANFDFLLAHTTTLSIEQRENILRDFTDLTKKHPNNAALWLTQALLEEQNNELKRALNSAQQAIELQPDYISAIIVEANLLNQLGQTDIALDHLKRAVRQYPEHKQLTIVYARLLIQTNQLKAAQNQFATLVKKNPEDSDLILSMALLSWENNLHKQAKKYLNQLLENNSKQETAHLYLAQIYTDEKAYDKAIEHYQRIPLGPMYANAQIAIADLHQRNNDIKAAQKTLAEARIALPQQAIGFYAAEAELLNKNQQTQAALAVLDNALISFPKDQNLLYTRAMLYEQMDDLTQMETDLRAILADHPNSALALNALGYTLADKTDRYEEALELIKQAIEIKPNDPAIIDSLGWVHYKLGNHTVALQYLQKAYQMLKDHEIAAHLGEVLWQSGRIEQAKRIWSEAFNQDPDSQPLQDALKRLWPEKLAP